MYLRVLFLVLILICLPFLANARNDDILNVYTWYGFLPAELIQKFEAETGIKVNVDYYDSNSALEAKLFTGNSGYDVVFPSAWPYLERHVKTGLYSPLKKELLSNWHHLDPKILSYLGHADPGHKHAIPYLWGVTGIGYNKEALKKILPKAPVDSLAMLFDPKIVSKLKGIYLLDEPADLFSAALIYLGLNPELQRKEDLKKAFELIKSVRPYIKKFCSEKAIQELASSNVVLIQNWSGDIARARRYAIAHGHNTVSFAVPKEGTSIWIDTVAIPRDAKHPLNAHKFLNFLMRPKIIATVTNHIANANANRDAKPFIKQSIRDDPIVYPKNLGQLYVSSVASMKHDRLLIRYMTRLKTGR